MPSTVDGEGSTVSQHKPLVDLRQSEGKLSVVRFCYRQTETEFKIPVGSSEAQPRGFFYLTGFLAGFSFLSFSARTTRAQLSLGLADHTHGTHSQPASITVQV